MAATGSRSNWRSAGGTASRIVVRLPVTPGCAPASTTAMVGGGRAALTSRGDFDDVFLHPYRDGLADDTLAA